MTLSDRKRKGWLEGEAERRRVGLYMPFSDLPTFFLGALPVQSV